MTILDLISKAAGLAGPELIALLERIIQQFPDLAPIAQRWLNALNGAIGRENLVALGKDVVNELGDIAGGNIDGRPHPSDTI